MSAAEHLLRVRRLRDWEWLRRRIQTVPPTQQGLNLLRRDCKEYFTGQEDKGREGEGS